MAAADASAFTPRRQKANMILIVDDDIAMAENCSMFLESQGFDVTVAGSGAEALLKIREMPPELVISDCAMPGMSGPELSAHLKRDPSTARLPILLMSASRRSEVAGETNQDAFLRKLFLAEHLLMEVRQLLSQVSLTATLRHH